MADEDPVFPRGARVVVTCEETDYRGTIVGYLPGFGTRMPPSLAIKEPMGLRKFDRARCSVRLDSDSSS